MAKKRKTKARQSRQSPPAAKTQAGKARLIFPPSPGVTEGFTASSQSSFAAEPSSFVRELVQNGLDAALVSAGRECAIVRFVAERHKVADIPGMPEYKAALAGAMNEKINKNELSMGIAESLRRHCEQETANMLFVSDNGIGFDAPRLGAMLGDGVSEQSGEESRGAFGNGHLTAFALSHLRYAFYGGVRMGGGMLFSGHAVLASHRGEYRGRRRALSKDGYYVRSIKDDKTDCDRFDFPRGDDIPPLLRPKMERIKQQWQSGSVVAVAAFNNFNGKGDIDEDVILREAALNFYVAIWNKKLRVEIESGNKARALNRDDLPALLERSKDNKRGKNGFPSGRRVWSSFDTLKNGERHIIKTAGGEICLILRKGGDGKRVAICRNGMWITGNIPGLRQADFGGYKPFDALLLVDAGTSGAAHNLIKQAETPLHNEIKTKSRNMSAESQKKLRALLGDLRDTIKGLAEEKNDESFSPDDIMPIEFAAESIRGERPKLHEGTAEPIGGGGRQNTNNKAKTKSGARTTNRPGSAVKARISSRRTKSGRLSAIFIPAEDCEDVEMRLSLDGGEDITCAGQERRTITLAAVSIGGREVLQENYVYDDKNRIIGVCLGEWKAGQRCNVEADYHSPAEDKLYALVIDLYRRKAPQGGNKARGENAGD